jgi:hypothetical protein
LQKKHHKRLRQPKAPAKKATTAKPAAKKQLLKEIIQVNRPYRLFQIV